MSQGLAMIGSFAPEVALVSIDKGFDAGCLTLQINQLGQPDIV